MSSVEAEAKDERATLTTANANAAIRRPPMAKNPSGRVEDAYGTRRGVVFRRRACNEEKNKNVRSCRVLYPMLRLKMNQHIMMNKHIIRISSFAIKLILRATSAVEAVSANGQVFCGELQNFPSTKNLYYYAPVQKI
jgi:hypothetical protein